jgi:hypothetical protein
MNAGLSYTALRDTILAHRTIVEGLIPLFSSSPSPPRSADAEADLGETQRSSQSAPAAQAVSSGL